MDFMDYLEKIGKELRDKYPQIQIWLSEHALKGEVIMIDYREMSRKMPIGGLEIVYVIHKDDFQGELRERCKGLPVYLPGMRRVFDFAELEHNT